jgi:hypothetical protein
MLSGADNLIVMALAGVGALIVAVRMFRVTGLYEMIGRRGLDPGSSPSDRDIPDELVEIAQMREAIAAFRQKRSAPAQSITSTIRTVENDLNLVLAVVAPEVGDKAASRP